MQLRSNPDAAEVRRHLNAMPELVFAAFADPALVRRWLKPAPEIRLDVLTYDFRPGGLYRFAYHVPGSGVSHVNGAFAAIVPPSRIVFSWNIEPPDEHAGIQSEVRVSITPSAAGSEVFIQHVKLLRAGAPERHAEGWRGALEGMARVLGNEEEKSS